VLETAVFESVIRVVDRLIDLLKYRQAKRRELFSAVIEPLFDDLLVMHADYMKMFDDCWQQLLDNQVPLRQIAEALRQRRQVYEGLRIKSNSIIDGLEASELAPEVRRFVQSAAYHIPDGELGPVLSTPSSLVLDRLYNSSSQLIDVKHRSGDSPEGDRRAVLDLVISTANASRKQLAWICEEYIRLRLWALK
jgi:hypothetical protein